jgi:hypothetical protein
MPDSWRRELPAQRNPIKKVIGFDQRLLNAIDDWRCRQNPVPSMADAVRSLLAKALAAAEQSAQGPASSEMADGADSA